MIDERKLAELRKRLTGPADMEKVAIQCASWWQMADTLAKLWKVARAAEIALNRSKRIIRGEVKTQAFGAAEYAIDVLEEPLAALDDGKEAGK